MNNFAFEDILHLVSKGYSVEFEKAEEFRPSKVLRIHLSKDDNHCVELVDISIHNIRGVGNSVEYLVSRALHKAEWEFEYHFKKED